MSVDHESPEREISLRLSIETGLDPCIVAIARRDEAGAIVDFEYLDLNDHAVEFLGRERSTTLHKTIREFLPHEFAEELVSWLAVVVSTQRSAERLDVAFLNPGNQSMGRFDVRATANGDVVTYAFRDLAKQRDLADRYRILLENSSDIVMQTDFEGLIEWVSDAVTDVLGFLPQELIGTGLSDLMHPEDAAERLAIRARMNTRSKIRFRVRLRDSDGEYHHFGSLAHRVVDAGGTLQGVIAGLHLIDEVVHTEQTARIADERYRLMAANGTDVIALERRGIIEWVSPYMERLLNVLSSDVVGHTLAELVHPDDRASLQTFYRGADNPEMLTLTLRMRMADASYRWVSMRSHEVVDELTNEKVRVTTWRDAQKDVAGQRALIASEGRFRLLAETATDVVVECDSQGVVRWVSPSALSSLGWTSGQVLGSLIDSHVFAEDVARIEEQRVQLATHQSHQPVEVRYLMSTGNVKWMSQRMHQVRGPSVDDDTIVIGLHDIDEIVRLRSLTKETDENFHALADNVTDVVYRVNLDGELTWVSPSIVSQLGWMVGDVLGHSVLDLVFPEDHARVVAWRQLLHFGEPLDELTIRVRQGSGDFVWMKARARPTRDDDGRVDGVVVSLLSCEAQVVTSRALRTISAGSRVLMRVNDARELIQKMCQVAVEEGGYLLAWYGKKMNDDMRTVKAIATSTGHESYLDGLEVRWAEDALGFGPAGRSVRSGQTCTVSDIDTDSNFEPWRENAHRHGFRSTAAIPVLVNGQVDGSWQVYAMEPRAFTPEVLTVLEDMAMEIGYGLSRLGGSDF